MKILVSDYDDTLYVNLDIKPETIELIKTFQDQGNLFIINTGRHLESVYEECDKFDINPDFYICNNGNVIANKNRETIYIASFNKEKCLAVIDYFDKHLSDKVYYIAANDGSHFGRKFYQSGCQFMPEYLKPIEPFLENEVSTMFSQAIDGEETMAIVNAINEHFDSSIIAFGNKPFIDIVEKEHTKGLAIEKLAEDYSFNINHIYTIGDSYNDISMLKSFNGYAMSISSDSVKQHAKGVVDTIDYLIKQLI